MDAINELRADKARMKKEIRQLQNRQKILLNKMRNEEYKARTRRLIVHGANLESVFPVVAAMSAEETLTFLRSLSRLPGAASVIASYQNNDAGT